MTSKKEEAWSGAYRVIPVSRLHIDLNNPRHEPVETEAEAIAKLCDGEMIAELAKDIVERGSLSPLEIVGVVPRDGVPGHFVAVEGNRRTCALIVLSDPNRAPPQLRAKIKALVKDAEVPREVRVHVFKNRREAKQWIALRHLGLQGGAGTKTWDPTQQTRAADGSQRSSARDNALAVAVLDRLTALGHISKEERDAVSVTTLTRYLGTPGLRAIVGLGSPRELIFTHDPKEVDRALLRLIRDSISKAPDGTSRVHSRSDTTERQQYANELKLSGDAPTTLLDAPTAPPRPSARAASGASKLSETPRSRSANHPDTRKSVLPSSFSVRLNDSVLLRLRGEALAFDCDKFSFAANYLLRAIIERVLTLYLKDRGRWNVNMPDQALVQRCSEELKKEGVSGKPVAVLDKAGGNADCAYSLYSLGATVHGGTVPTATDLKKHFETWRPALDEILAKLFERQKKTR